MTSSTEYFIKKEFDKLDLGKYKEFIHFGLTSQDINNTAIPLSIKAALLNEYFPHLEDVLEALSKLRSLYQYPYVVQNTRSTCLSNHTGQGNCCFFESIGITKG